MHVRNLLQSVQKRGAWGLHPLSANFSSGHDLGVHEFKPHIGLRAVSLSAQSPLWILCPPLSTPLSFALSQK